MKSVDYISALNSPVVNTTDRSKAVVPVLLLLCVDLWLNLRGFLSMFFIPFSIAITSLGKGES